MSRNRTKATTIAFILMLTTAATLLTCLPTVSAADIPTFAFLAVAPNPVGVGQTVIVTFWLSTVPPTAAGSSGDRWQGFTVTITKPGGTTQTMGPYTSDPVGGTYFQYVPDTVGTYYFQFSFPGQSFPDRWASLFPGAPPTFYPAETYAASPSPKVSLTVQQEQIPGYPSTPLPGPNEYWTRPIEAENRDWWSISGNWLGSGNLFGWKQYDEFMKRYKPRRMDLL